MTTEWVKAVIVAEGRHKIWIQRFDDGEMMEVPRFGNRRVCDDEHGVFMFEVEREVAQ